MSASQTSQPARPQRQNLLLLHPGRRLFALCRSARSRASPRLNVHCSPLTTASVRPATRLVLGESPHRRRWTPRCSEPGYGGVGVTVHPACDPSQPSVTQSDALLGQPKMPFAAPLLLLECSHTACGGSLWPREPVSAPAHLTLATTHRLTRPEATSVRQARERDGAYRDRARRRAQEVDTACHHKGRMPVMFQ